MPFCKKKRLLVGTAAAEKAHLLPLQAVNRFWDRLNTIPLEQPNRHVQNHAEIASAHLAHIWRNVKAHGDAVIITVPDFFGREQLGLLLGIARELSIPVKGFVSFAVAASSTPYPGAMLLNLDIHLHRFELVYLGQGERLTRKSRLAVDEIGLEPLYRTWVETVAAEFVRSTRFDPLHQAATEQALYDRLPAALQIFKHQPEFVFELANGKQLYQITLRRDLLIQTGRHVFAEMVRLIENLRAENDKSGSPTILQLSHRIAGLPGLIDTLSKIDRCKIVPLQIGAGAFGALHFAGELSGPPVGEAAAFYTSRAWLKNGAHPSQDHDFNAAEKLAPTHLLYGDTAYPLSGNPLVIGSADTPRANAIRVPPQKGVSKTHCTVGYDTGSMVLTDHSLEGTYVNEKRVDARTPLALGQTIRLGTSNETFRLIACIKADET